MLSAKARQPLGYWYRHLSCQSPQLTQRPSPAREAWNSRRKFLPAWVSAAHHFVLYFWRRLTISYS